MTRPTPGSVLETIGWAVVAAAVWLATVAAVTLPEGCFAVAAGLVGGAFAPPPRRSLGGSWRVRPRWALWAPQVAATLGAEVGELARVTVRHAPPHGRLRTLEMPEEDREHASAREALATIALCSTPGSVVVD